VIALIVSGAVFGVTLVGAVVYFWRYGDFGTNALANSASRLAAVTNELEDVTTNAAAETRAAYSALISQREGGAMRAAWDDDLPARERVRRVEQLREWKRIELQGSVRFANWANSVRTMMPGFWAWLVQWSLRERANARLIDRALEDLGESPGIEPYENISADEMHPGATDKDRAENLLSLIEGPPTQIEEMRKTSLAEYPPATANLLITWLNADRQTVGELKTVLQR